MNKIESKRMHLILGLLALAVVLIRIIVSIGKPTPALYYFTVQSNLFVALYWLWVGLGYGDRYPKLSSWVAGAVTTYITITMLLYMILLHGQFIDVLKGQLERGELSQGMYYLEVIMTYILHMIIPILMLVDYIFFTPSYGNVRPYQWLLYPVVYGIGHSIYGLTTGKYLYPFLNPEKAGGWSQVLLNVVMIFVFIAVVGYGLYALNRWMNRRLGTERQQRIA